MTSLPTHMPPPSGVHSILHPEPSSPSSSTPTVRKSGSWFSMRNKIAVITGAGRGMGLEIAVAYAEAGAVVYCLDLAEKPSDDWERCRVWVEGLPELPVFGDEQTAGEKKGRLEYVRCDVTQHTVTQGLVDRIADKEGSIDVCVICAGIVQSAGILECDEANVVKHMQVNFNGALFTTQAATRQMVKRGTKGSIVIIASIGGSVGVRNGAPMAYSASKAALLQLSRSIACELGPKGIRCNTISPGVVLSDMTKGYLEAERDFFAAVCAENPLGRVANLDEVRGAALFLGSDASTFCTGSNLMLDGGHTAW